mgnify:CR=1 FL=1
MPFYRCVFARLAGLGELALPLLSCSRVGARRLALGRLAQPRCLAAHRGEAYLLEAGPGTGKTQTLIARVGEGRIITYREGTVAWQVHLSDYMWKPTHQNQQGSFEGVLTLIAREVK